MAVTSRAAACCAETHVTTRPTPRATRTAARGSHTRRRRGWDIRSVAIWDTPFHPPITARLSRPQAFRVLLRRSIGKGGGRHKCVLAAARLTSLSASRWFLAVRHPIFATVLARKPWTGNEARTTVACAVPMNEPGAWVLIHAEHREVRAWLQLVANWAAALDWY